MTTTPDAALEAGPGARPGTRSGVAPAAGSRAADAGRSGGGLYRSTKTYDHNEGLSCCFRQWRATESHCRLIHGYALAFRFVFATRELDHRNWCLDFGGLKAVRGWLHETFDHTMLVAADDPHRAALEQLGRDGLADVRVVPAVGCEATAEYAFDHVSRHVRGATGDRVWLESVEVSEHGGNSAIYERERHRGQPDAA